MTDDLTRLMERVNRVTAERDDARAEATDLRARVAASEAERERLAEAGDNLADVAELFWIDSPCEHGCDTCPTCETERFGLLEDASRAYRAARSAGAGGGAGVES